MTEESVKFDKGKRLLYTMLKQFSLALSEVTKCSEYGHNKYKISDSDWNNFSRLDNAYDRYSNSLIRHTLAEGNDEESGIDHDAHAAWNALARLECKLRKEKEDEDESNKNN